jgi:hypothetical protein
MTIFKAHWDTQGDDVRLSMPFSKVDIERRTVSGFATLDNIDKQRDVITTQASMEAFANFRGNIREMHQPSAVGKMVSFKEDKYFDPETKKFYSGVYVSAYISKGANDTWEKVLDGTYAGFSIGGKMIKWDDAYDEKMDSQIRVIQKYDLIELSLVDSPANQFANILSIEKVDGKDVLKGIDADTELENVFWDSESGMVMISDNESQEHPLSGVQMKNIGFVEKSDEDKKDIIKFLVDSAKGTDLSKITKEESPMTDETANLEEVVEKSDEVAPEVETVTEEEGLEKAVPAEDEEAEKADEVPADVAKADSEVPVVDETPAAEDEVAKSDSNEEKMIEINKTFAATLGDLTDTIKALAADVAEMKKSVTGVSQEVSAAKKEISETKGQFDEFGKRFDAVEQDTAFRKSGDVGNVVQEQPNMVAKSLWGGRFLKNTDLFS